MRVGVLASNSLFAILICTAVWAQQSADDILQASGTKAGLVVQIGCGAGRLLVPGTGNPLVVQGLDTDPKNVEKARAVIRSLGQEGKLSADVFDGQRLPYADNLVNLIVAEDLGKISMGEVFRVLCPGGIVYVRADEQWTKTAKPWSSDIDQWTHYLHGPDNNAVAQDTVVGPPRHVQWISGPRFSRSHDHLASVSAVVSARGRLFYIVDLGSIAFAGASPKWRLVARDAFNGMPLWEREIPNWEYHLRDFRSGPAELARRLVAVGDRVYVTLGYQQPVTALDAATGATVRTYAGTEATQEIVCHDDVLFLVLGDRDKDWPAKTAQEIVSQKDYTPPFERYVPPAHNKRIVAVAAQTGEVLWNSAQPYTRELMPTTLAVAPGRVYFQNLDAVVCLDASTGELKWQAPRGAHRQRLAWSTPTLVVHDGVVYSADRGGEETQGRLLWLPSGGYHQYLQRDDIQGQLIALDGETGKRLWSCPAYEGFNAPVDVMIADGLLWTGHYTWTNDPGITEGRDPKTGEVRRQAPPTKGGHARCYRAKATAKYLVMGRRGIELVDLQTGSVSADLWVRGICQYGVMPANGLLYVPPHSCACSPDELLKFGFMVLAPATTQEDTAAAAGAALEQGPAYARIPNSHDHAGQRRPSANGARPVPDGARPVPDGARIPDPSPSDWPTYRHDPARSGAASGGISQPLQVAWQTALGGKLTSPVIAGGFLLVAQTDAHCVHALDAATGKVRWTYATSGRIDSPPTIDRGRVLFGSADGRVYCLRLDDGALAWKFRAGPRQHQIMVDGQLESAWPVPGSVLVADGAAYFVAGRSSHLDGGMFLYKLDAATGETLKVVDLGARQSSEPKGKRGGGARAHLPDVLSTDGNSIFMRSARFDRDLARQKDDVPHIWSSVGFLDDSWWHRTYWQFGTSMGGGWGGWPKAGQQAPAGRLLVTDGKRIFGFGRNQFDTPGAHVGVDAAEVWGPIGAQQGRWTYYRLFGRTLDGQPSGSAGGMPAKEKEGGTLALPATDWTRRITVIGQGMVLAGQTLLIGGPADTVAEIPHSTAEVDPLAAALETTRGGRLLVVSKADGKTLAQYELPSPPVFDGMAAAHGRLYLSTKLGQVVCMVSRE